MRGALPRAEGRFFWSSWAFLLFICICSALARCETADLELTKRADSPAPYEGETLVYTITLANRGPDDATGVEVSDPLPAGLTYVWHRASQGSYEPATGRWVVGSLAASASAKLEITALVENGTAGLAIVNTAEVAKADQADPDSTPGNGRLGEDDLSQVTIVPRPRPAPEISGSLSASLTAYPESTAAQTTKFDLGLRVYANFTVTLSGLTVSSLGRLDLAGLEYEALTLRASLGWLQISDLLIFARGPGPGELTFQRKVFSLAGQLQGLELRNLLAWAAATPSRFDDTLTVRGRTAAGATVTSETRLCLGPGCDHPLSYERVTISGISIGGVTFWSGTTFRPAEPVEARLALQFKLAELATVNASLELWPALLVSSVALTATNDLWGIVLNYDPQLELARATVTLLLPLSPGLSVRSTTTIVPGEEIGQLLSAVVRAGPWELSNLTVFGQGQLQSTEFALQLAPAELGFLLSARFTPTGLEYVLTSLRIGF
ncbi:MAG: DUF11 domain-containing protein [Candidatus Acetothermia bacterium]|nr:DUF11 domain-containing protein [Candidatus Acetothermia bacterium]